MKYFMVIEQEPSSTKDGWVQKQYIVTQNAHGQYMPVMPAISTKSVEGEAHEVEITEEQARILARVFMEQAKGCHNTKFSWERWVAAGGRNWDDLGWYPED